MKIKDYWLEGTKRVPAHDVGGTLAHPRVIVIHYTAGGSLSGAVATLTGAADPKVSAHVVIDKDGTVVQCVGFDRIAYHAGASVWQGRAGVNTFGIGIELVNRGPMCAHVKGHTTPGAVVAPHKHGGPVMEWDPYPDEQLSAAADVCRALIAAYGPMGVVGHDDISPGRKIDPGPAFPASSFVARVLA